jgi:4-hydroxybutyrate dehydrogenase
VRAAGVLDMALAALGDLPHAVFDSTPSNPTEAAVRAALAVYQAEGCDGLVAVGGGSSIDLAKGVAIAATRARRAAEDLRHHRRRQPEDHRPRAPLIAVPTTAGTGSEVARGAIVIVDDGRKLGFHSWHLMPKAALLDPELTLGLPPADRGHRHGRHRPLHGDLHGAGRQPAGRRHRAGRPGARLGAHRARHPQDGSDRDARWP